MKESLFNGLNTQSNGGCAITSYKIYVDDGNGGSFTEYDPSNVNGKPFMHQYDIDMTASGLNGVVGSRYRIKVGTENNVAELVSDSIAVLLASAPDQPPPATSISNGSYIIVVMTPPRNDGGNTIYSYQL